MPPKVAFSALLLAVVTLASAQSVNLEFPDAGDRQVWTSATPPADAPSDTDGVRTLKSDATLSATGLAPTAIVYVWDRKTGNLASKTVKEASAALWVVKPGDFQQIAEVTVHVEHDGKPVAAATVDLDDGKQKVTQLLVPSNNGAVTFFGIKPGSLKITVHYKVTGKEGKPVTQLLDASLTRTDPIPIATIALANAVDTVAAAGASPTLAASDSTGGASSTGTNKGKTKDSGGAGFLGALVIYLVALGGMGALIYYAIQYMKKNPDSVGSKLEQLGVQMPKPGGDPLTNPAPVPMPKAPAPVQKIILGDAAPDLIAPVATSTLISDPRLVSQNGDSLPLPEGDLIVGREVGLGLSLVGESTVSRKHAQITRSGGSIVVTDFGSTNGTFVNGIQVQGDKQLQAGDTVQFGSVRFRLDG